MRSRRGWRVLGLAPVQPVRRRARRASAPRRRAAPAGAAWSAAASIADSCPSVSSTAGHSSAKECSSSSAICAGASASRDRDRHRGGLAVHVRGHRHGGLPLARPIGLRLSGRLGRPLTGRVGRRPKAPRWAEWPRRGRPGVGWAGRARTRRGRLRWRPARARGRPGARAAGRRRAPRGAPPGEQRLGRRLERRLGRLDQRQLELGAGVRAVLHRAQRGGDQVEQPHDVGRGDAVGLLGQALVLLRRDRQLGRHLAERARDQQRAGVRLEVARRSARCRARTRPAARRRAAPPARRPAATASTRAEQQVRVGRAQHGQHVLQRDRRARVGDAAAPACPARRGTSPWPSGRSARTPRRGSRSPSSSATRRSTAAIWPTVGRPKSNRWQRSTTVGRTLFASVVASTKIVFGGGSSSVLRNAFHAAVESMCASSRM